MKRGDFQCEFAGILPKHADWMSGIALASPGNAVVLKYAKITLILDGNKRIVLASSVIFLKANGHKFYL